LYGLLQAVVARVAPTAMPLIASPPAIDPNIFIFFILFFLFAKSCCIDFYYTINIVLKNSENYGIILNNFRKRKL
jgi:hypothetical protein